MTPPAARDPQRTLLTGGVVRTMDGDEQFHEALVLEGERIAGVGEAREMDDLAGRGARRVDLGGATVLPGLIDTHPHLLHFGALAHSLVDIADAVSHADIVERIRERASCTPPGEWIMTTPVGEAHYFIRRSWRDLAESELPDRHVLDAATRDHPVWIQAWAPRTPNVTAFNSAGLQRIGITRDTPAAVGRVWIDKDPRGEPIGRLRGSVNNYYNNEPFWDGILATLPLLTERDAWEGTLAGQRTYHGLGVTTVFEGHVMGMAEIGLYRALREQGLLTMRVQCTPEAENYVFEPPLGDTQFSERLRTALAAVDRGDDMLRVEGVTISRGGPCWPGFMVMRAPYRGPYGNVTNGIQFVSSQRAEEAIAFCASEGLRLNIVAVGDREHDEYLEQLERAAARHDFREAGWILQHAFFVEEGHARRYAGLGFDVTTSLSFSWGKGDLFAERVGDQVLEHLIPLRRLLDSGVTVGCGSDWGPKNVFEQVALALTHRFAASGRQNLGPAQRVSREEALAMWTREAARVLRWEGLGTLAPGTWADLVMVDRDPVTCEVDELPQTQVLTTMVGGDPVHDVGLVGGERWPSPA